MAVEAVYRQDKKPKTDMCDDEEICSESNLISRNGFSHPSAAQIRKRTSSQEPSPHHKAEMFCERKRPPSLSEKSLSDDTNKLTDQKKVVPSRSSQDINASTRTKRHRPDFNMATKSCNASAEEIDFTDPDSIIGSLETFSNTKERKEVSQEVCQFINK